jgi:NtrC-family two-component system response regulator AlgB
MGDVDVVADSHLRFFANQMGKKTKGFSPDATKLLRQYSWPGNLRELRNAIERAVILASDDHIQTSDFPDHVGLKEGQETSNIQVGALVSLEEIEKEHIRRVLSKTHTQEEAANVMGIDPATLYRKRKKYEF